MRLFRFVSLILVFTIQTVYSMSDSRSASTVSSGTGQLNGNDERSQFRGEALLAARALLEASAGSPVGSGYPSDCSDDREEDKISMSSHASVPLAHDRLAVVSRSQRLQRSSHDDLPGLSAQRRAELVSPQPLRRSHDVVPAVVITRDNTRVEVDYDADTECEGTTPTEVRDLREQAEEISDVEKRLKELERTI